MRRLLSTVAALAWGCCSGRVSVSSVLNPSARSVITRNRGVGHARLNPSSQRLAVGRTGIGTMEEVQESLDPLLHQGSISSTRRVALLAFLASAFASQQSFADDVVTAPRDVAIARGVNMPTLALNTAGLSTEDTERAVTLAVSAGVRHVDFHPGIERDGVARALQTDSGMRQKLFLTSKIRKPSPKATVSEATAAASKQIDEDLAALGIDRFDMLMLRDSPSCDVMKAQWRVMEDALKSGKTRSIGVVNYCQGSLSCLLSTAKVKPAVNYYMLHPGMGPDAHGLRSFGEKQGVRTFAYGAFGEPGPDKALFNSPVLKKIASAHGSSVEEVVLQWALQSGVSVSVRPTTIFGLGKSACSSDKCKDGLDRRGGVFSLPALNADEMRSINEMNSPDGNPTLFSSEGCPGPSPLRP